MKLMLVLLLALFVLGPAVVSGEKGTNFDKVEFIQYSDDNTAVEEVKNGHLDIYYSAIPIDRLDDQSKQNLKIFQSSGTSYSLLLNPAISNDTFNPFSIQQVRFALNYLIDRDLIVDEVLNGYGTTMISAYKPYDPDYLLILYLNLFKQDIEQKLLNTPKCVKYNPRMVIAIYCHKYVFATSRCQLHRGRVSIPQRRY